MSAISEKVRLALYSKMNVSGVTSLATGGIHHKIAPESANYPFIVFQRVSGIPSYTFGLTLAIEDDVWMVKALADEDSSTTKSPQALCEDILTAVRTALGTSLTITPYTNRGLWVDSDMPEIVERLGDREIHQHGIFLRIKSN